MCAGNRPNFNSDSGLTPNGGGAGGVSPGSAPKGNAPDLRWPRGRRFGDSSPPERPPRPRRRRAGPEVSRPTSTSLPRPSAARAARPGVEVVEVAAATPTAGVETEALSRPGTAAAGPVVEPDAQSARRGHGRVTRRVDVLADAARANPFTPPAGGPLSAWR